MQGRRLSRTQHVEQVAQGTARIHDVLHHEHVPTANVAAHVHEEAHRSGSRGAPVAGERDELDAPIDSQAARQVGKEDEGSLQHADEHDLPGLRVIAVDLSRQLVHPPHDRLLGDQDGRKIALGGWRLRHHSPADGFLSACVSPTIRPP